MNITEQQVGDIAIIKIEGQLNAGTAPVAESRIRDLVATNTVHFVLDLSELSYIASAGIRVFQVAVVEARRRSGDVRLVGVQPLVKRSLELVGLVPTLKIYDDVAAALASFS